MSTAQLETGPPPMQLRQVLWADPKCAPGPMGGGGALGQGWSGPERLIGALGALAEIAEVMEPPPLLTVFKFS